MRCTVARSNRLLLLYEMSGWVGGWVGGVQ